MLIEDPAPLTEDVMDLDFAFVGGAQTSITLAPTDTIEWETDLVRIEKGPETIQLFTRNLLYVSSRQRKRALPAKPLHAVVLPPVNLYVKGS